MLEAAGVRFELTETSFDEAAAKAALAGESPAALARGLARGKALGAVTGGGLVLGADQVLEAPDGTVLGKPESPEALRDQLHLLSGREHIQHSAAAIAADGAILWEATETARLRMRELSESFIAEYAGRDFEANRTSAGGYRIEAEGSQLFESIEGSHFAILGLPLLPLLAFLRERGELES